MFEEANVRVHMYFDKTNNAPVRLLEESVENRGKTSVPMLTYDYSNVELSVPEDDILFELPK